VDIFEDVLEKEKKRSVYQWRTVNTNPSLAVPR